MGASEQETQVAVIGGGFAGTMAAVQLARRGIAVSLIGRGGQIGKGVAYSTNDPAHLLNIPAAKMSAWPDRPDDFVEAIADVGFGPEDYVPRLLYGHYLRSILEESQVTVLNGEAIAAEPVEGGWTVRLDDGRTLRATAMVLAPGNQPPDQLPSARGIPEALFASNPWDEAGKTAIAVAVASGGDVLAVGSGLSMIDVALSLDAAGHRGKMVAVSRRGQVPRVSLPVRSEVPSSSQAPSGSLSDLWRWLRRRANEMPWRDAVDSLRPRSHELWHALSAADQRRFLRHARPWWDIHRHRIAPPVGATIERMLKDGRLEVMAGRIRSLRLEEGPSTSSGRAGTDLGIEAVIRRRGASHDEPPRRFAVGINCTGPLHDIRHSRDPLLRSLLDNRLAEPDHLGIGLKVDEAVRVIGPAHEAPQRLWAMGSLGKARYWEITAVPDIRVQAEQVAEAIAKELDEHGRA